MRSPKLSLSSWRNGCPKRTPRRVTRVGLLAATIVGSALAWAQPPPAQVVAPGWSPLAYPAPEPGSYQLSSLGPAADGKVLDSDGQPRHLSDFFGDKIVVLSFIYTSCPDVNACPMATYVLTTLQAKLLKEEHGGEVRLLSLSFNPEHDRPEVMRGYGERVQRDGGDWRFLTTSSETDLAPILESYGQSVRKDYDLDGHALPTFSHILRVFLIDREKQIRNIYTTSFLHADTVWSDIETLRLEEQKTGVAARSASIASAETAPGEPREHTNLGLPKVVAPADNPLTQAKIALGRKLFFDRRLSHNDTMSCAMCHIPDQGFTSNEMATAVGIEGQTVRRNAPTIYNVAFLRRFFHDGRESSLEQQIWGPLLASNEMGNPAVGYVLDEINRLDDYRGLFEAAFDGRRATMATLGMALASYERTIVSGNSRFDRWRFSKDSEAMPVAAIRGFGLFTGKAGCADCHVIEAHSALFTDQQFHNTGIGYRATMGDGGQQRELPIGPGGVLRFDPAVLGSAAEKPPSDLGRYEITHDPDDRWRYKTPTLRNVALTAPYMHNGSLPTLRAVVELYNRGGFANELLDPRIHPLQLDSNEVDDLVAFLESLTGDNIETIVSRSRDATIGDP